MQILTINTEPFDYYKYQNAVSVHQRSALANNNVTDKLLPIYSGTFSHTNSDIGALIIASDLQGIVYQNNETLLLGEALAEYLALQIEITLNILPANTVVLFAGDLFALPEKRGGYGDVMPVYHKFAKYFKHLAGVLGNHDYIFKQHVQKQSFHKDNIDILHLNKINLNNIKIAGISGITGESNRPNRIPETEYLLALQQILNEKNDIILLHESPAFPEHDCTENIKIRNVIENAPPNLIISGHRYRAQTICTLPNGSVSMNVNEKVIILKNTQN